MPTAIALTLELPVSMFLFWGLYFFPRLSLTYHMDYTGNLEEASDFQEAPEPCLGGNLRADVSCPILIRKYFCGIGST